MEILKTVVSSLFVALVVSIPIVWTISKIKSKKIKKSIPGDMDKTILKYREQEKEVQNEREKREEEKNRIRQLPAIRKTKEGERKLIKSNLNNPTGEESGGKRELQKTETPTDARTERHSKEDWPVFS